MLHSVSVRIQKNLFNFVRYKANNILPNKTFTLGNYNSSNYTKFSGDIKMEWPRITLFGDSITRMSMDPENGCWASYLSYTLSRYFDVNVRGFDGYNTRWALEYMPKLFSRNYLENVELFIIFFGHNDSWESELAVSVAPSEYESNLKLMIEYLTKNGIDKQKIILISPSWYHESSTRKLILAEGEPRPYKSFEHSILYNEVVSRVGMDESIDVLDFFKITSNYKPLEELFYDGIHLSKVGARLLYNSLMPIVKKKIETKHNTTLMRLSHVTPYNERLDFKESLKAFIEKQKRDE